MGWSSGRRHRAILAAGSKPRKRREPRFIPTNTLSAPALSAVGEPRVDMAAGRVTMPVDSGQRGLATVVQALDAHSIDVDDTGLRRPTLDEVFLTLTGVGPESAPATETTLPPHQQ
jgi:hypothetical protein